MGEKKPAFTMSVEPTIDNYGTMLAVAIPALRTVLEELAAANGGRSGKWLDDLEEKLLLNAKGTEVSGMAIPTEAKALTYGIEALKNTIAVVRRNLAPPHDAAG